MALTEEEKRIKIENFLGTLNEDEQIELKKEVEENDEVFEEKPEFSTKNLFRVAFQGTSFGFGDELEAITRSVFGEKQYKENLKEIRSEISKFKKDFPATAIGAEVVGSLPTAIVGGAGLARLGLKAPSLIAGTEGAIYGFGSGEDNVQDRLKSSAITGTASAVGSKILGQVAKSESAKKLIKEGVNLTTGQTIGGVSKRIEDSLTSLPFSGGSVEFGQTRALEQFNNLVFNEALKPINKQIKKGVVGQEAFNEANKLINQEYDKIIPKTSITNIDNFNNNLENILSEQAPSVAKQVITKIKKIGKDKILTNQKDGTIITGKNLKDIDSTLGSEGVKLLKGTANQRDIGNVLLQIRDALKKEILFQNPNYGEKLEKANQAFRNLLPINNAVLAGKTASGVFTPSQLLRGIQSSDFTKRKKLTARGKAPLQTLAQTGQQVFGNKLPESGTANRLLTGLGTAGLIGADLINPFSLITIPTVATTYRSGLLNRGARNLATSPSLLRPAVPSLSSQTVSDNR